MAITGVENRILGVNHGEADWDLRINNVEFGDYLEQEGNRKYRVYSDLSKEQYTEREDEYQPRGAPLTHPSPPIATLLSFSLSLFLSLRTRFDSLFSPDLPRIVPVSVPLSYPCTSLPRFIFCRLRLLRLSSPVPYPSRHQTCVIKKDLLIFPTCDPTVSPYFTLPPPLLSAGLFMESPQP